MGGHYREQPAREKVSVHCQLPLPKAGKRSGVRNRFEVSISVNSTVAWKMFADSHDAGAPKPFPKTFRQRCHRIRFVVEGPISDHAAIDPTKVQNRREINVDTRGS